MGIRDWHTILDFAAFERNEETYPTFQVLPRFKPLTM